MNTVEDVQNHNYDDDNVDEDIALLTNSINAIQSELFVRQMYKEQLNKKVAQDSQKIADNDYLLQKKQLQQQTSSVDRGSEEHQPELLYQPTELNIGTKKLLSVYLDQRADELKDLLKEASNDSSGAVMHSNTKQNDVHVNIRCGHGADYVLRLKLPQSSTFGEVCIAAKDFFGIPTQIKVVLRDDMGNYFSDDINMKEDFSMLPEQNLHLVHATSPDLAELQKYQISDMQNVHTGGLSRRKRDESRGLRIMRGLISDLPKSLVIFVIMLLWLFGGEIPMESAYLNSKIQDTFFQPRFGQYQEYNLKSVTNVDLIWDYLSGPLVDVMFTSSSGVQGVIEESTYILGSIRLRQQRVSKNTCTSRLDTLDECYGAYFGRFSGRVTDDKGTSDYWGNPRCSAKSAGGSTQQSDAGALIGSAFTKHIDHTVLASSGFVTDTDAEYFEGALAYYDPSGYVLEVSLEDRTKFRSIIAALKECQWIDLATRIIYVEVNFFNPTMNTYLVGHLRFEIDTSGLVLPDVFFQSLRLDIMSSTRDKISYGLECVILVWCCYQVYRWRADLVTTMEDTGSIVQWFLNVWTLLEVLIVGIFFYVFSLRIYYLTSLHRLRLLNIDGTNDANDPLISTSFIHLGSMAYRYTMNSLWMVIVTFFASLKLLKYMKVGRAPRILIDTLRYAVTPMFVFMLMFLLIMSGFVLFFHSIYGTRIQSFSTVMLSTRSLLTSMISQLVSESEHHAQMMELPWSTNILYSIVFVVFLLVCHFVLLNVFLAIMNDAHKVAHDIAERTDGEYPSLTMSIVVRAMCGSFMARKCGDTSVSDEQSEFENREQEEKTAAELEEEREQKEDDEEEAEEEEEDALWRKAAASGLEN